MSDSKPTDTADCNSPGCRTREAVFAAIDAATDESAPGRTIDTDRFFESLACSGYLVQWAGAIGYRNMADATSQAGKAREHSLSQCLSERGAELQALIDRVDELVRVWKSGSIGKLPSDIALRIAGLAQERDNNLRHYAVAHA